MSPAPVPVAGQDCALSPGLIAPGGRNPDWSAATVPAPAPAAAVPTPQSPRSSRADRTPPAMRASLRRGQRLRKALRRGLRVSVRCSEACRVRATLVVAGGLARRLRLAALATTSPTGARSAAKARRVTVARGSARLARAGSKTLKLKFTHKARKRLRRLGRLRATLMVRATDAAGNAKAIRRKLVLRR